MAVTNSEQVYIGALAEIRVQNKTILVLLPWVAWHVANSSREGIFCDHIMLDVFWFGLAN